MVGGSRDADDATNRARDVDRRPTPKQRAGRATAAGSHLSRHRRGSLRASPQPKAISSVESNASPLRDSCARERAELLNRRSRGHVRRDSVRSPPRGSRAFRARRCVRRVERICSEGGNRGKNQRACKTCTCGAGADGKPRCVWTGSPQFPPFSNFVSFFLVTALGWALATSHFSGRSAISASACDIPPEPSRTKCEPRAPLLRFVRAHGVRRRWNRGFLREFIEIQPDTSTTGGAERLATAAQWQEAMRHL